uniref:Protein CASP n=1 Tax=Ascaris lumbricoides TaxID=6252 RepID=A0A0M3IDN9_ASCLU
MRRGWGAGIEGKGEDRVEELEKSRQMLTNELEQEKTLVKQLESDLFTLHNTMPRSRADGADADELLDVTQECSTVEMLARELNVMDQEATKNVKSNLGNNVLSIMTAQRDRLRGADADELLDVTQECSTVEMLARELNVMDQEATKNGADADELLDVTQECSTVEMLARELNVMDQEATKNVKSNLGNNVLSIMTAQRDRLRVRVEELELELSAQKQQNALLQSELDNAHQDNVKMYGKIKFLQSYQNKKLQPESINSNAAEAEVRYENEYEKHMDPFRKFNIQERQRKYAQLRPHDKAILGLVYT